MQKKLHRIGLFLITITGLLFCIGCGSNKPKIETERHAFLLEKNMVFVADIPKSWRYILYPVDDYFYYKKENHENESRVLQFIGVGEEYKEGEDNFKDGEDNFFIINVHEGKGRLFDGERICEPFTFQDGTAGEWEYCRWEDEPHYGVHGIQTYYEGNVYDLGKNYSIHLSMLGSEYDAHEEEIRTFLESACFRTSNVNVSEDEWGEEYELDLGISEEKEVLKRELLTLHIWNKSIRMSLRVPEGAEILTMGDRCYIYLDDNYKNIGIYPDEYNGETLERTGDFLYRLNVKDFEETVYEIPRLNACYFPNQYLLIWMPHVEEGSEIWEYAKRIVQSMRFE